MLIRGYDGFCAMKVFPTAWAARREHAVRTRIFSARCSVRGMRDKLLKCQMEALHVLSPSLGCPFGK